MVFCPGELDRLLAVLRDEHLVALALEHLPDEAADDLLVLDDQHPLGGLGSGSGRAGGAIGTAGSGRCCRASSTRRR